MFDMFDIATDGDDSDKVRITVSPPGPPEDMMPEEDQEKLEEGMAAKPTLKISVYTGRDFQQMVDNIHGCFATLAGGLNITASTTLAKALMDVINDQAVMDPSVSGPQAEMIAQGMMTFQAFSSFSSHSDIRYKTEKLEAAVCDEEESEEHKQQVEMMKVMLPHQLAPLVGEETVRTAAGLKDYTAHLHSIRFAGELPGDYEIYMEFGNFHLTPVISEFLQLEV